MELVEPGTYEHFKGNRYEVLGVSTAAAGGTFAVVYVSKTDGRMWHRQVESFTQNVKDKDGRTVPRFRKVDV